MDSEATQLPKILGLVHSPARSARLLVRIGTIPGAQDRLIGRCANPIVNAHSCRMAGVVSTHTYAVVGMFTRDPERRLATATIDASLVTQRYQCFLPGGSR